METRRGVTGAALGSAAGVGLGVLTGGDVVTGALVGAAAGAAIGVGTTRENNYRQAPPRRRYYDQDNYHYDDRYHRHDGYYYR
jgi:hypothetical protein